MLEWTVALYPIVLRSICIVQRQNTNDWLDTSVDCTEEKVNLKILNILSSGLSW